MNVSKLFLIGLILFSFHRVVLSKELLDIKEYTKKVIPLSKEELASIPKDMREEFECYSEAVGYTLAVKGVAYLQSHVDYMPSVEGNFIEVSVTDLVVERSLRLLEKNNALNDKQKEVLKSISEPDIRDKYDFLSGQIIPKAPKRPQVDNKLGLIKVGAPPSSVPGFGKMTPFREQISRELESQAEETYVVNCLIKRCPEYKASYASRLDNMIKIFKACISGSTKDQAKAILQIPHLEIEGAGRNDVDYARVILQDRYFNSNGSIKYPFRHDNRVGEIVHHIFKHTFKEGAYKNVLKVLGDSSSREILDDMDSNPIWKGLCWLGRTVSAPVTAAYRSFTYPDDIQSKILSNSDNQAIKELMNVCEKGDFRRAKQIQNSSGTSLGSDLYNTYYQEHRAANYTPEGILKKYSNDPKWKSLSNKIKNSISGNEAAQNVYNNFLEVRYNQQSSLKNKCGISTGGISEEVNEVVYKAIEILDSHEQLDYLLDKAEKSEKVHDAFFTKEGVLKWVAKTKNISLRRAGSWDNIEFNGLNQRQLRTINSLYVSREKAPENVCDIVDRGVKYLYHASKNTNPFYSQSYTTLAESIAKSLRNRSENKLFNMASFVAESDNLEYLGIHSEMLDLTCKAVKASDSVLAKDNPYGQRILDYILMETESVQDLLCAEQFVDARNSLVQLNRILTGEEGCMPNLSDFAKRFNNSMDPVVWRVFNDLAVLEGLSESEQEKVINGLLNHYKLDRAQVKKSPEDFREHAQLVWDMLSQVPKKIRDMKLPSKEKVHESVNKTSETIQNIQEEVSKQCKEWFDKEKIKGVANEVKNVASGIPEKLYEAKRQFVNMVDHEREKKHGKTWKDYLRENKSILSDVAKELFNKGKDAFDDYQASKSRPVTLDSIESLVDQPEIMNRALQERERLIEKFSSDKEFLEALREKFSRDTEYEESRSRRKIYKARIQSISDTIANPENLSIQKLHLTEHAEKLLLAHEIDPHEFNRVVGNAAQLLAYAESVTNLNNAADLLYRSPDLVQVENTASTVAEFSEASCKSTQFGNVYQSFKINDFCSSLLEYTTHIANGVKKGVVGFATGTWEKITHPVETCASLMSSMVQLGQILEDNDTLFLTDQVIQRAKNADEHACVIAEALKDKYEKSTGPEIAEGVAAFVTEQAVMALVLKGASNLWKRGLSEVRLIGKANINLVTNPEAILATPCGAVVQEVSNKVVGKTSQIIPGSLRPLAKTRSFPSMSKSARKLARVNQKKFTKKLGKDIVKKFNLEKGVPLHKQPISRVVRMWKELRIERYINKRLAAFEPLGGRPKITRMNWRHVLKGEIKNNGKKCTGYHSSLLHPECSSRMVKPPNKFGVYEVVVEKNGIRKFSNSTMFPDDWSLEKIIDKTLEAYNNSKVVDSSPFSSVYEGITFEGINIKIVIDNSGCAKTYHPFF